mmetsp:Transcript_29151/g.44076  ORF Transcript_29151/g.44076 Transcript_29151/m.44076 type:complete len:504 (-) Transcript_29151:187-1698(-)
MPNAAHLSMSQDEKKQDDTIFDSRDASNSLIINSSSAIQLTGRNADAFLSKRSVGGDMNTVPAVGNQNINCSVQKNTIIRSKSRHFSNEVPSNMLHSPSIISSNSLSDRIEHQLPASPRRKISPQDHFIVTSSSNSANMTHDFGLNVRKATNSSSEIRFDSTIREIMEEFIAKGREIREERRQELFQRIRSDYFNSTLPIGSDIGVPYPSLRKERSFLYDEETYPLDKLFRSLLGVSDLSLIHEEEEKDKKCIMKPLLNRTSRQPFHECYDNFVTSFCIPLLHSLAMMENIFTDNNSSNNPDGHSISYRYQAFPCIHIIRPGEFSIGPHCDMAHGHSIGNINFHIPLTPTYGTNALYTESWPGREDWHPLTTKAVGMGFVFDGARCLHYSLENTTPHTRVSMGFRIAISRKQVSIPRNYLMRRMKQSEEKDFETDQDCDFNTTLCSELVLQDNFSLFPGYYDEAYLDSGNAEGTRNSFSISGPVVQKTSECLLDPDKRVGFPF